MTRKDYVALAKALRAVLPRDAAPLEALQWRVCVDAVARVCAADNARFDRSRFDHACGYADKAPATDRDREF